MRKKQDILNSDESLQEKKDTIIDLISQTTEAVEISRNSS